ncbi:MAG: histidine phosphatase family protein [Lachnospiraceae bacterium]
MELYFIRHGATKGNLEHRYVGSTDEPMLLEEKKNLQEMGNSLPHMDYIFVSPYLRCIQSKEALFGVENTHMELVKDFREMDFGEFEYKNYEELKGNVSYQHFINSGGTVAFPGGEEPEVFKKRCGKAFITCLQKAVVQQAKTAAFVIHGGTIMAILEQYAVPQKGYYDYQVKNGQGFQVTVKEKTENIVLEIV